MSRYEYSDFSFLIPRYLIIRWMERLTLARLMPILLLEMLLLLIVTILLLVTLRVTTVAMIAFRRRRNASRLRAV